MGLLGPSEVTLPIDIASIAHGRNSASSCGNSCCCAQTWHTGMYHFTNYWNLHLFWVLSAGENEWDRSVKWLTRDRISLMLQPWSHGPDSYLKSSIFHQHIFFWGIDRLLVNAESGQGELGQLKNPWNISLTKGMVFNTSSEYSSLLTMTSVVDKVNGFRSLLTIGLTVLGRDCDGHRWHCLCKTP